MKKELQKQLSEMVHEDAPVKEVGSFIINIQFICDISTFLPPETQCEIYQCFVYLQVIAFVKENMIKNNLQAHDLVIIVSVFYFLYTVWFFS